MRSTEPSCNMRGKGRTKKFHICWVTEGGFKALQCKQIQTNLSFQFGCKQEPETVDAWFSSFDLFLYIPQNDLIIWLDWHRCLFFLDRQLSYNLDLFGFFSPINDCLRMWLCLMFMGRTTQTRCTESRKIELKQIRNKNGGSELLTITIKIVWRSLALCTCWTLEFTSCGV